MPLAPGPFRQGSTANINVESQGYDFTDDALVLQGELAAIAADWEPLYEWLEAAAVDSGDVALGLDLGDLFSLTDEMGRATTPSYIPNMVEAMSQAQAALDAAIAFAPSQAWTDPGAPYVPPDSALTLAVPTVNAGTFTEAPIVNVGPVASGAKTEVTLTNLTRYGSSNFVVGDQFSVYAFGNPGDELTAEATFNGEPLPPSDWGQLTPTGQLTVLGTMGPENVGAWSQQWFIAGVLQASFNFVVTNS